MSTLSKEKRTSEVFLVNGKDETLKRFPSVTVTESHCESRLPSPPPSYSFKNDIVDEDSVFIDHIPDNQDRDVMHMSPWRQHAVRLMFLTALVPQIVAFWGAEIQLKTLYQFGSEGRLSQSRLILAWLVVVWDLIWTVDCTIRILIDVCALAARWRPRIRLLGDNVPSVDVIVTVCNEQIDIVKDTVRGALSVDYPTQRFRVIVADDGRSKKMEDWVHRFSAEHPNLHYTARIKPGGWKAGNLNAAIRFAEGLPGGAAELVAGLDADMIPEPRWLRSVTAHLMRDRKVGVACPVQHFYNLPSDDPLHQANTLNWYCKDLVADLAGVGFNLGSGWVMRREAVEDIGGFPTEVLTEDITSSMMAMAEGWKTVYVPEALQWGLVPDSYAAHIKQITRWNMGGCQMATKFGFFLLPSRTKKQTWAQRLAGFAGGVSLHIRAQVATLSLPLMALVFMTGTDLVYWRDLDEMRTLLRVHCAVILLRWLQQVHQAVLAGYRHAVFMTCHIAYTAPYSTIAWLRTFILPKNLGGKMSTFTPTGSIGNTYHERDPGLRAPLIKRLRHIILDCGAWMHALFLVVLCFGAYLRFSRSTREYSASAQDEHAFKMLCIRLLQKVAWPSHPWILTALACITPVQYAFFPPEVIERDKLLGKRGKNGARYPTPEAMGTPKRTVFGIGFVELYTVFIAYVAVVFVATWWVDFSALQQ
ncbi:Cellulose synthase 2 [Colletotrichum chlorophyti]|uniref:Cellulose synthase 2 n=1 Tax=Colletotrichum chlorophyti TaxID=708187 RepID=A0A1Q8RWJ2_9PEZI|nr:Cellulose synthase 2 [Colletotrichum chlorophyti]